MYIPQIKGISRVADNERALLLHFDKPPTDEQMRALHDLSTMMSALVDVLHGSYHALRSYQHGNASPELAQGAADCASDAIRMVTGKAPEF